MRENTVFVTMKEFEDTMYYLNKPILHYQIKYPQFSSTDMEKSISRINAYYYKKAMLYRIYVRKEMFRQATQQYLE